MSYLLNLLYGCAFVLLSPWLLYKVVTTGKYRRGLLSKLSGQAMLRRGPKPCAWFHGVSVGEIFLLRQVIARFRERHPDWECVVSTTTATGWSEACKHYPDLAVFFWPGDFTWAVRRALRRVNPSLVILAESEIWPNFLAAANERQVPVAVINGRMSPRSFRRYRLLKGMVCPVLNRLELLAVQTEAHAAAFRNLGVAPAKIQVTGSVKFDGARTDRGNQATEKLRRLLGVQKEDLVWIAGSTQAPEEEINLAIYTRLKVRFPNLRLLVVPRQPERFREVAALLERSEVPFLRRSELTGPVTNRSAVILVDTMGELGALWGLADVAFVGGSLDGRRGGQNMIEPAAYGAAVVFGPHVWNFAETVSHLVEAGAAIQVANAEQLAEAMERLLADPEEREKLGTAARHLVLNQQGATERTMAILDRIIDRVSQSRRAA